MYNKDYLPEKSHRFIAHTGRKGSKKIKIMNLNDSFFFLIPYVKPDVYFYQYRDCISQILQMFLF